MNKHRLHLLWAACAATTLTLSACGGGDDDTPAPAPTPAPTPSPGPSPAPSAGFIEQLDTRGMSRSAAKVQAAAVSRLPAQASVPNVALGPLSVVKAAPLAEKGVALKIGEGRDVAATASPDDLARAWRWATLADGSQVAAVSFTAEGAKAIRLGVLAQHVPAGAVLRFYGAPGTEVVEVTSAELNSLRQLNESSGVLGNAARMYWGPDTAGDISTLEVQLPPGIAPAQLQLAVPQLSHWMKTVSEAIETPTKAFDQIGWAGSCNLDVMCEPSLDPQSRSVAHMTYQKDSGTYMCTGTLMNDTRNSQTPYFLSGHHCVSTQEVASTVITYWFFRAASCNGSPKVDEATTRVLGGTVLRFTHAPTDSTLLQLNRAAPASVVYAGSYYGDGVGSGTSVLGIHNPRGDLQKFSVGAVKGYSSCTMGGNGAIDCDTANAAGGNMFIVGWQRGITEGGSSGSAIFAQSEAGKRYVVGNLMGGSSSCQNPNGSDHYGRFGRSFAAGINKWLAP
ncbi:endoproteinase ArgC [Ottowia sp. GY511]|uniref:Trypsin-like serine peptidase n=1 Tax=Ottowia flava TaxID=2675430 RepID=A0ABW4KRY8_9BURK|nr:endoproteinase ArgC [Ottowia sp. GY511]TXK32908.1 endoproteinase ArgC [Ottowia sp. GY511]